MSLAITDRYTDMETMAADLERFLAGQPVMARPLAPWSRAVRWMRQEPMIASLALLTTLILVGGSFAAWSLYRSATQSAHKAEQFVVATTIEEQRQKEQLTLFQEQAKRAEDQKKVADKNRAKLKTEETQAKEQRRLLVQERKAHEDAVAATQSELKRQAAAQTQIAHAAREELAKVDASLRRNYLVNLQQAVTSTEPALCSLAAKQCDVAMRGWNGNTCDNNVA